MENTPRSELKKNRVNDAIRSKKIKLALCIALAILVVVFLIWGITWISRSRTKNAPGVYYPPAGQQHIGLNDNLPTPYNSNPPSSGAHYGKPATWYIYDYEANDRIFIHNLEHGGIWIAYRPNIPPKAVEELKLIVNEFGGSKIVMAPRSANDADIAVVAWSRVLKFDLTADSLSDKEKEDIKSFYRAFKNKGPEFVPDTMPGIDPKSVQ